MEDEIPAVESKPAFVPPEDGSWVPKERLDEATGKLKDQLSTQTGLLTEAREKAARLEGQLATEKPEPTYTRPQLLALVEEGKLSQGEADVAWEQQLETRIEKKFDKKLDQYTTAAQTQSQITAQVATYKELMPDLMRDSEDRSKVQAEYQYLMGIGQPPTVATELAAIRSVFGDIETLKKTKQSLKQAETYQETGGGGRPDDAKKGVLKTLSQRETDYYEAGIKKGMYKDWAAVEEELKFANNNIRKKHGAKL